MALTQGDAAPPSTGEEAGPGPARFALIIGAMKAGTTSLFHYLAAHPEIAPSRVKEPKFFIHDDRIPGGLAAYQELWPDWDPDRHTIALEGSTGYTKYPVKPNAAERIARFAETQGATFRFLYIMRDPVEKFVSRYMHALSSGWTTERPAEWIAGGERLHLMRYASQLDEYYERFPADTIHTLLFEDLRDDPETTVARALEFLGLEPARLGEADDEADARTDAGTHTGNDGPAGRRAHNRTADKRLHPLWLLRARQLGALSLYRSLLPEWFRLRVNRMLTRSGAERIQLSPDEEQALIDALAPDLLRLEEDYGIDLARWPSTRGLKART